MGRNSPRRKSSDPDATGHLPAQTHSRLRMAGRADVRRLARHEPNPSRHRAAPREGPTSSPLGSTEAPSLHDQVLDPVAIPLPIEGDASATFAPKGHGGDQALRPWITRKSCRRST